METPSGKNFALTGAAGYIAPRHLKAIRETGNSLIAATDPHDSVGILDKYFPSTRFFKEFERFDRFLEKNKRANGQQNIDYFSICSPNFLHDAHIRYALRVGAHAICEKPMVLNPWNLDALNEFSKEYGKKIYTILQLRSHPQIQSLKKKFEASESTTVKKKIELTYITSRGHWYLNSWKGNLEQSGGLVTNIGIHFFDMLIWIFGNVQHSEVHLSTPHKSSGALELENAQILWYLSIDENDLPEEIGKSDVRTWRSIKIDGEEIEFSNGFSDLHTIVYREILNGAGWGPEDARPSILLAHNIRTAVPKGVEIFSHPLAKKIKS